MVEPAGLPLDGKVALVTGGAHGIGRATVIGLRTRGASVAFTDIMDPDGSGREAGELFIRANAAVEADAARAVSAAIEAFGRLDIVVNNVGNRGEGDHADVPLAETSLEAWNATIVQSLTTCMLGMKYALPALARFGGGVIVNVASLAGLRVTRFSSPAYTAAKAGVVHVSRQLAVLHAQENIRINVVAPGLTLTPNIKSRISPEIQAEMATEFHPMARMITPDEVAEAIIWAASPSSSGVTGHVIPVDGGWAAK